MRNQLLAVTTVTVVIFLCACNRSTVSLDYTNAKGEVQPLGNLVFRFDKPLISDSLLNIWDSSEYISFEPAIPGRFRWERPDQLVFSPSRPLTPATTFKATLKNSILQYSKYGKISKGEDISFSTPYLQLDNSNVTWMEPEGNSNMPVPQVDLYFNYAVNPGTIKDKLKLALNGQPLDYTMLTLSNDSRVSLRLAGLKAEDKDLEASLTLDKGLLPEGGKNGTKDIIQNKVFIPSPYNLTVNDVHSEHDGISGSIIVRTSQQVMMENIASFIHISPS